MIRPKNKKFLSKQQAYAERIKMKRILSKAFDREWKRKKAAAQAKRGSKEERSTQNYRTDVDYF